MHSLQVTLQVRFRRRNVIAMVTRKLLQILVFAPMLVAVGLQLDGFAACLALVSIRDRQKFIAKDEIHRACFYVVFSRSVMCLFGEREILSKLLHHNLFQ